MIESLFATIDENFKLCLYSKNKVEAEAAIEKLKASLLAAENYSEHARNYSFLFLKMFQFRQTASDSVWEQTPKLYAAIGEFIHLKDSQEDEFRNEVTQKGLGSYLEILA